MTPAQCAEYLQVSIDTLYVWTSQRKIPFRKAGGALRFDFDEIVQWTKRTKDSEASNEPLYKFKFTAGL